MAHAAPLQGSDRPGLGIALTLLAWALFSCTDISAKWLVVAGLPAVQLVFARYFVSFAISLTAGLARGGTLFGGGARSDLALVALRAILLAIATLANFIALNYLPLAVTSSIINSSPIIVTLLAIPLLGEKVGPWRMGAALLGFIGVLIVIRPFGNAFHWASLLVLTNATCIALFAVLTRKLSGRITPQTMQIYVGAIGSAVMLPLVLIYWKTPDTLAQWAIMTGIGVYAWAGHELFSRAHIHAEANLLSPFGYSFILYLSLGGFLLFGTVPDAMTFLGAAVIVASGLIIWWRETYVRRHHAH